MMRVEVSIAVNFVLSFLYNRLPRRRVNLIGDQLQSALVAKFQGHWYPEQPLKGTAYRSLKISGEQSDPILLDAAKETGLDAGEVMQHLPMNLTLWIDPGEVSCRVGEKGPVTQLYSSDVEQQRPQDPLQDQQQQQLHQEVFTAAAFAQTKFGSTKLRQPPRMRQPRSQHQQGYHQYYQQQQQLPAVPFSGDFSGSAWSSDSYCISGYPQGLSVAMPTGVYGQTGSGYGSGGSSGHSSPSPLMSK